MSQTTTHSGSPSGSPSIAGATLVIGWGAPVQGREQKVPQVLKETLQYCKNLQANGEIDSVEPIALEPHGRDLNGFLLLRGSSDSLNRIRASEDFQRMCHRTQLVTTSVDVIGGYSDGAFDRMVNDWTQSAHDLA